ncbi:MAG TPA: sensor histidine kinase [Dinghuibacter sp.]|uniref:sensor histidine kinase n=1 Tax=Dinghuibacter sp. TaxID=2024697 RepID=UPI002D1468E6|nr:sensor histidine kinase [Dinghuibacter sp.]HTJ13331.1 sensor histidine kinase [Dinghuibacter sp.]
MKRFDWTRLFTRPYKVYTQAGFWIVVYFLYILLKEYPSRMTGATLACLVLQETLELMVPCYTQNLLVLPFFKRRAWYVGAAAYFGQLVLLITILPYILNAVGWVFGGLFHITDLVDWRQEHIAFSVVAFTVVATFVRIGSDRLVLDRERRENELRHLKAQLNPHFLFNTLNNLYGLSVAESKRLPGLMLQLSDLLRYSLYETGQAYVALEKEAEYIRNYVELERIRLSEATDIWLETEGDFTDAFVAPLLLIVLVENGFKHFSASPGQRAFVHIRLSLAGEWLRLHAANSVDDAAAAPIRASGGLGLRNLRQRLDLIYEDQYSLTTRRLPDRFEADLQIKLT